MASQVAADGYLVRGDEQGAAILALHAWWGLNLVFRQFCDALAREGWTVLAPDLYHGAIATTVEEAKKQRSRLKGDKVRLELERALAGLRQGRPTRPVGVVGFSLGGYWGLWLTEQLASQLQGGVFFYASRSSEFPRDGPPLQFHLAEEDEYVSLSGVKKMRKTLRTTQRQAEFHIYSGTHHWFAEPDRPEYDQVAAALAWERTVEFLHRRLDAAGRGAGDQ